jgi:hypothetical protein
MLSSFKFFRQDLLDLPDKITAVKLLFNYKDEILKGNIVHVFPARRAGLGFATFFWKVAKKRNPNNPVDPVQINIFTNKIYRTKR